MDTSTTAFKVTLAVLFTLGAATIGLVHWIDALTPNWIGGTLMQIAIVIAAAFKIQLPSVLPQVGPGPSPSASPSPSPSIPVK